MVIGEVGFKARVRLVFAAMAAAAVFVPGPACAQDFVMKFATQTINDVQHEFIKLYKAELEKATNNRIRVDIYPASQLGGAQRQSEGLRLGTIEAATGPAELFVGADPRFQGLAMAGLFKDIDHVRHSLLVPQVRQTVSDLAASRGLMFNAAYVYDTQSFNTKAPMTKLADFTGKRIRVLASESEQAQVNSLGASAVPMSAAGSATGVAARHDRRREFRRTGVRRLQILRRGAEHSRYAPVGALHDQPRQQSLV